MATKRPLVLYSGRVQELLSEDNVPQYPQIAYPKRIATPKIIGDVVGASLVTVTLTVSRLYFFPFIVPRNVILTGLRISVTTASAGTASIGIYNNTVVGGEDFPGSLLASVTGLDTGTTGDKTGSLSYTLNAGTLYWACIIGSAAATLRGLGTSQSTCLGRVSGGTTYVSYLYAAGSGSTLPPTAPASLGSAGGLVFPAIYLLE